MQAGPERLYTQKLIVTLEKASKASKAPVYARVAAYLKGAARKRPSINLTELGKHTPAGKTAVVPGKVLSMGTAPKVTVAAFAFSAAAKKKIEAAGGKTLTLDALLESKAKPSSLVIIV